MQPVIWLTSIMQLLVVLVLFFGDIGFDKPGKFGLDFDHFVLLMILQIFFFVGAIAIIIQKKNKLHIGVQLIMFWVTFLALLSN